MWRRERNVSIPRNLPVSSFRGEYACWEYSPGVLSSAAPLLLQSIHQGSPGESARDHGFQGGSSSQIITTGNPFNNSIVIFYKLSPGSTVKGEKIWYLFYGRILETKNVKFRVFRDSLQVQMHWMQFLAELILLFIQGSVNFATVIVNIFF